MSTIEVAIAGRGIQVKQGYEKPSAGDVNTCEVSLAIESGGVWDSLPNKRVTFATRTASVTVDYAPTIAIPHEVMASPGALYLTITGYDADGIEVARTHRMTYPIEVAKAGADEGAEPSPATLDVVSRIDALAADLEEKRDTDYWRGEPGKDGAPGAPGEPGADGYSPIANVTKDGSIATITVTDKNGTTTATVSDGAPGKDGSDATATDVRINGTSITTDGVADIPIASNTNIGLVKLWEYGGLVYGGAGLETVPASEDTISARNGSHYLIPADSRLDYAVKAAMCDGKGAAWTVEEKLAARDRLGIGGSIDITTLTFEEPVNNAILTFQTPKPYSTLIVQFYIPKTPEDTNARACPMYLDVSKQDGSDEKSMYTWINIPNIANSRLNYVGLLSNDNGLWNWQVKGPIDNDYYANSAWITQLPSYKNPADFIVKERPYVKKIYIGWVSSAFPAGSSITAYGVL